MGCNKKNVIILLFAAIYCQTTIKAQSAPGNRYFVNPRFFCAVPHPVMNRALRSSFVGIYDINPSLTINPFGGFQVGAAYKHSAMYIPANKIAGLQQTKMLLNNAGIRLGYDQYISKVIFWSYFFNFGQSYTSFKNVPCVNPRGDGYQYSSLYFEPEISVNFLIEDFFAIGICASFNYTEHIFSPDYICLDDYATYLSNDTKNPTGIFNIGFGFYYGLARKK